jgi:hypothetical protein
MSQRSFANLPGMCRLTFDLVVDLDPTGGQGAALGLDRRQFLRQARLSRLWAQIRPRRVVCGGVSALWVNPTEG